MNVNVETAIDPVTGERFHCVFDAQTCLPVEPIQRFLNYCIGIIHEFDRWYAEAIAQGFCLDIPRRCLSTMGTEPLVKVVDKSRPDGYRVMPWREAREYQERLRRGR